MTPVRTAAAHLPRAIAFGKFDDLLRLTKRNEFGILFWFTAWADGPGWKGVYDIRVKDG